MKKQFEKSALIIVDLQNDFCPGGALAVPEGDQVVGVINNLIPSFPLVVATQDWHPAAHSSFKQQGGIWPPHCIQNTTGAELHPDLRRDGIHHFFRKGFRRELDAYSGFEGVEERGQSLDQVLRDHQIEVLYITGLATDYCVKATAMDGLALGYRVVIVEDAVRGVNLKPGDDRKAIDEVLSGGGKVITSWQLLSWSKAAIV